jgi:hypothetical protein
VPGSLGIVAGSGALPGQLIAGCQAAGHEVFVVAIKGETEPETVAGVAHLWLDIGAVGRATAAFRKAGCETLCLIGGIERPALAELKPDWQGLKLLPRLAAAAAEGDDAMLRVVVEHFEAVGFRIVGAEALLADLGLPAGPLGCHRPDAAAETDIEAGIRAIRALGPGTVAQAVVVRDGRVLAIEGADGTDAMLARCERRADGKRAGVLVKWPKSEQERRVDLPTIGPETVAGALAAGLEGIAAAANGALVAERARSIDLADEGGLFIVGIDAEPSP